MPESRCSPPMTSITAAPSAFSSNPNAPCARSGLSIRNDSFPEPPDAELIAEMQRFARGRSFDEGPMPALDSEALDFRVASELFAPVRKLTRRNLESLRLLTSHQGRQVPTVGAVLLFGRERLDHFPDAWIQAGRFDGTNKATILDHAELKMPLVQAIEEAIAFVEKHSLHGCRDWPPATEGAMELAASRGPRGDRQRGGPRRLLPAGCADPRRDLRRSAGGGEPGPVAVRTDRRRPAARSLEAEKPGDRPCAP